MINWLQAFFFISITRGNCPKSSKVVSMVLSRLQKKTIGFFLLGLFLKNMYLHSSKEQTVFVKNLIFFMRNMKYQTLSSHVMYFTKESVKIGPLPWQWNHRTWSKVFYLIYGHANTSGYKKAVNPKRAPSLSQWKYLLSIHHNNSHGTSGSSQHPSITV